MSTAHVTVKGTITPDGRLALDDPLPLPAGQVLVTVQPVVPLPAHDAFWRQMEQIWAGQRARGHVPRSAEEIEAERQAFRDEWGG